MKSSVKKVSKSTRVSPLEDLASLASAGRAATRAARLRAKLAGVSFTYAKNGRVYKRNPDGSDVCIRVVQDIRDLPSLESDLCPD